MGVSEKRQNFHFGVEYAFKSLFPEGMNEELDLYCFL